MAYFFHAFPNDLMFLVNHFLISYALLYFFQQFDRTPTYQAYASFEKEFVFWIKVSARISSYIKAFAAVIRHFKNILLIF